MTFTIEAVPDGEAETALLVGVGEAGKAIAARIHAARSTNAIARLVGEPGTPTPNVVIVVADVREASIAQVCASVPAGTLSLAVVIATDDERRALGKTFDAILRAPLPRASNEPPHAVLERYANGLVAFFQADVVAVAIDSLYPVLQRGGGELRWIRTGTHERVEDACDELAKRLRTVKREKGRDMLLLVEARGEEPIEAMKKAMAFMAEKVGTRAVVPFARNRARKASVGLVM